MKYWIALACSSAAPGFILVTLSIKELQSNFPFNYNAFVRTWWFTYEFTVLLETFGISVFFVLLFFLYFCDSFLELNKLFTRFVLFKDGSKSFDFLLLNLLYF